MGGRSSFSEVKPAPKTWGERVSRATTTLFPGMAARRAQARASIEKSRTDIRLSSIRQQTLDKLEGWARTQSFGGYTGASKKRGLSQWSPGGGSPDEDLLENLHDLRERNRDLIRNDPHAAGLIDIWVSNVVGRGLLPQPRIDWKEIGITEEQAKRFQMQAAHVYRHHARSVDVTEQLNAGEVQELVMRQVFENGDVFVIPRHLPPSRRRLYTLAAEVIEADRVTTPSDMASNDGVREGVAVGDFGQPLAYYVRKTHPGDLSLSSGSTKDTFVKIPRYGDDEREQIHHLFRMLRPGQSRGAPFLSPAIRVFRHMQQYFEAELVGAKVAACFALFIVSEDPFGDVTAGTNRTDSAGTREQYLEPGRIERLAAGEDVKGFSPNRPGNTFDTFMMRALRAAGAAVNTPYELLSMDFSNTTYTSGRMALLEVWRVWEKWQAWLAENYCQPMYERLIEEAWAMGEIDAPGFLEWFEHYTACRWIPNGRAWVDPKTEGEAIVLALENNLTTLADELYAQGKDLEEVLEQRAREKKLMEKHGIAPAPPPTPGRPPSSPPGEEGPAPKKEKEPAEEVKEGAHAGK